MARVFWHLFFSCVEENYAVSVTITLPEEHFYCSGPSQRCASQVPFPAKLTGFLILCFLWSTVASSWSTVAGDSWLAGCLCKGGFGFSCQSRHSSLGCLVCRLCLWFFSYLEGAFLAVHFISIHRDVYGDICFSYYHLAALECGQWKDLLFVVEGGLHISDIVAKAQGNFERYLEWVMTRYFRTERSNNYKSICPF